MFEMHCSKLMSNLTQNCHKSSEVHLSLPTGVDLQDRCIIRSWSVFHRVAECRGGSNTNNIQKQCLLEHSRIFFHYLLDEATVEYSYAELDDQYKSYD